VILARIKRLRSHKGALVLLLVGAVALLAMSRSFLRDATPSIPTAEVKKGEFVDRLQLRGEVKAARSIILTAPSVEGDLQLLKLAPNGKVLNKGDVVVQFDTTTLQRALEERLSELKRAEAEIEGTRAQARLTEEQNLTDLLQARYDVERAKLETRKQEILSQIEAEKTKLNLADAEQRLKEIEQKLDSGHRGAAADTESKKQKRDKALYDVRRAQAHIASLTLRAPVNGMVTILPNFRAGGPFGGSNPEFKEGDRAWSGAAIAELPDMSSFQVAARIDEADRGQLKVGQAAAIRVDAVPERDFSGLVKDISPLTKPDFSRWPPMKNFDVALRLEQTDPKLRPGMSTTARVAVDRLADAILIPSEGAFLKAGRTVAYVVHGTRFDERPIEIARRGEGRLAVRKGLLPGERIALKDPMLEGGFGMR